MNKESQADRIFDYLWLHFGLEVPAIELHSVGSGKTNGFCASLSRRISDIRDQGYTVTCRRETTANGQVNTFYTLT